MRRLLGSLLGLLCTQVCCELGCPMFRAPERVSQLQLWKGGRKWSSGVPQTFYPHNPRVIFRASQALQQQSPPPVSLFLLRCERDAGGAASFISDHPGGKQFHAAVQLFCICDLCAVVSPKSWRTPHQPVLRSFRNKAEWKTNSHNSHQGTPQLTVHFLFPEHRLCHLFLCCGPTVLLGICSTHVNP
jgi:hypothetical protein